MLRMPSGIYPEVAFPRIVVIAQSPGLAVKDVEVAVTRPIEEAVSIVLGVNRVRSKSVRGAARARHRLRARHRHDPGPQRRSRPDGRGRVAAPARHDLDHRAADAFGLPDHLVRRHRRPRPGRRCTTTPITTCGRGSAGIADVSYVTVQGGDIREILVEVDPQAIVAAGLSIADVADRLGKEHRLKAVGRLDREVLQYQVLADTQATDPLDLENRVIASKNGQSIRLRDLGRVAISHEDRTMVIRANGQNAVALTVFRRLGGNALQVSRELDVVLADAAKSAPPGVTIRAGLRPGPAGADGHRQRPRRHHHRRRCSAC